MSVGASVCVSVGAGAEAVVHVGVGVGEGVSVGGGCERDPRTHTMYCPMAEAAQCAGRGSGRGSERDV